LQSIATEDNRDILQEIYKTGSAIKRMKDINSANSITYLLDSTLATQCMSSSSSSSSSESLEDQVRGEDPAKIWQLQLQMMAIIAAMTGSTRAFPVQFNENAAWQVSNLTFVWFDFKVKLINLLAFSYKSIQGLCYFKITFQELRWIYLSYLLPDICPCQG